VSEVAEGLPPGTPWSGYIAPDLSGPNVGIGTLPPEEESWNEARDEAVAEDTERVIEYEETTAAAVREVRLDESGVRLSSLVPDWCSIAGDELVLLHVYGSGFTPGTQIWWHDHFETTVFVSENELTTWVTPWLFLVPDIIDVGVAEPPPDPPEPVAFADEPPQTLPFRLLA
jgi:hypothetical protein